MARPVYVLEVAFASNPDDPLASQVWTDVTRWLDVKAGAGVTRGRADEFAEIQPSKLTVTLDNSDGRFTPGRPGSPYWPNVRTGKRIRLGLMWPGAGTQHAEDPAFAGALWSPAGFLGGPAPAVASGAGMVVTWATGGQGLAFVKQRGLVIGRQYTVALDVYVPTGSPGVQLGVGGITFGTTTAVKDATVRLSTTFVATANTHDVQLINSAAPVGAGKQCFAEKYSCLPGTGTGYVATAGVFSWRFTGDVDEWPLGWSGGPAAYAETRLTATDRFKKLGELGEFRTFAEQAVLVDHPAAYYPLTEPAASVSGGDVSGNAQPPLTIAQIGTGGTLAFGYEGDPASLTEDLAVPDFYWGRTTGVKLIPATNIGFFPQGKYLRAPLNAPLSSTGATVQAVFWHSSSGLPAFAPIAFLVAADGSRFGIHLSAAGNGMTAAFWNMANDLGDEVTVPGGNAWTDSVLLATAVLETGVPGFVKVTFYINGVQQGSQVSIATPSMPVWTEIRAGGRDKFVDGVFRGNLSHVAVFDYPLTAGQIGLHWRAAFQGRTNPPGVDHTYQRMNRLASYAGLETVGVSLGADGWSPKLVGPQEIAGAPLEAMRLVEATEDGVFYLLGSGLPNFRLRGSRFGVAPALTLTAARLDPGAVTFRGDGFGLVNDVTAARPDGAQARVVNAASVAAAGRRKASITAIPYTDTELRTLAAWQANTYGVDRNRVTGVRISLLNDPGLIPDALGVDIGRKLAVTGLPGQAPAAALELVVEGWTETVGEDEWSMDFNTSPAEVFDAWLIGVAGRSEIGTTTRIGY